MKIASAIHIHILYVRMMCAYYLRVVYIASQVIFIIEEITNKAQFADVSLDVIVPVIYPFI